MKAREIYYMKGKLFYFIGPSGAGKDTLLTELKGRVNQSNFVFVQRYITREPSVVSKQGVNEDYIYISKDEFLEKEKEGFFLMSWSSHEHFYGIPKYVEKEIEKGKNVLVNGSREYLPHAIKLYPHIEPILIDVNHDILKKRLISRGRESGKQLQGRLKRINIPINHNCLRVDNSGSIEDSVNQCMKLLGIKL